MRAMKVTTDNKVTMVDIAESIHEGLFKEFDGCFEIIRSSVICSPYVVLIDEAGAQKLLPLNLYGCQIYGTKRHGTPIVGDVFVMREVYGDDGLELAGITPDDEEPLIKDTEDFCPFLTRG